MLVHPRDPRLAQVYAPTRVLTNDFGLVGRQIADPALGGCRLWTIVRVLAPIAQRWVGGLRAELQDESGVKAWLVQRDLEVLLGLAAPGDPSPFGGEYVGPEHADWFGLCFDTDDLDDDLLHREIALREALLPVTGGRIDGLLKSWSGGEPATITRLLHLGGTAVRRETWYCHHDWEWQDENIPSFSVRDIESRWVRACSETTKWPQLD